MARILVVCGGDNRERRVSLEGGDAVARGLATAGHDVVKIDTAAPDRFMSPDEPLLDGPVGLAPPDEIERARLNRDGWLSLFESISQSRFDAVIPLLHGTWGEGGGLQAVLELLGIPFLGSGMLSSALALDKYRTHQIAQQLGIPVANAELLRFGPGISDAKNDTHRRIESALNNPNWARFTGETPHPVVLKPNTGGSTVGITISSDMTELRAGLSAILEMNDLPLLEEYVPGREVTVPIVGEKALSMIEIRPREGYYDYANKYTKGRTEYLCPPPVEQAVQDKATDFALKIYRELGCRHIARVDFRLTSDNQLILLEVNTIPGMTDLSLVPMAAKQAGMDFPALMDRFVDLMLASD